MNGDSVNAKRLASQGVKILYLGFLGIIANILLSNSENYRSLAELLHFLSFHDFTSFTHLYLLEFWKCLTVLSLPITVTPKNIYLSLNLVIFCHFTIWTPPRPPSTLPLEVLRVWLDTTPAINIWHWKESFRDFIHFTFPNAWSF